MHVTIQGPVGDEGMVMIGGADDDGLNVFLVEEAPPVPIGFCLREDLQGFLGSKIVYITQCHDVLIAKHVVMRGSPAPDADERDIQFVARGVLTA